MRLRPSPRASPWASQPDRQVLTVPAVGAAATRIEHIEEREGIRYRIVSEPRMRHPDRLILRSRMPIKAADPELLMIRLDSEQGAMAKRVLREGARGWRYWSTLRRHAGSDFSPFFVESQLLDRLTREAGLLVEDRFWNGGWVAHRFRVDESIRTWLGIVDPRDLRIDLERSLTRQPLLDALAQGPPRGMDWPSFDFVLRAAEELADLLDHGVRPGARELAGRIDHTKAWTERRSALLERLFGQAFAELVARFDRPIEIKGPIAHGRGDLWASEVDEVELRIEGQPKGLILIENKETFRSLLALVDHGYIVLWVPGGPPPAEVSLLRRLAGLRPGLPVHACFDLDPAGIRIARLIAERAEVTIEPTGMTPELFNSARRKLPLNAWDRRELMRLDGGRAASLRPLREAIALANGKVEQETIQRRLFMLFG